MARIIFEFEGKRKIVELSDINVKDEYINFLEKQSGTKTTDIADAEAIEKKDFLLRDDLIPSSYEIANFLKTLPENFGHTTDTISEKFFGQKVNYSNKDQEQQRLIRKYYATINRARDSIKKDLNGDWTEIPYKGRLRLFKFNKSTQGTEVEIQKQQNPILL